MVTEAEDNEEEEPLVQLGSLMRTMKEIDDVYDDYGSKSGLSVSAFWLLYALRERECITGAEPFTQKQFCREWSFSPQTANSSLKKMQEQGFIRLVPAPGNKKERLVEFTEKGRAKAQELVAPLMTAERRAFASINSEDRGVLLRATRRYKALLGEEVRRIMPRDCKKCGATKNGMQKKRQGKGQRETRAEPGNRASNRIECALIRGCPKNASAKKREPAQGPPKHQTKTPDQNAR